MEYGIDYFLAHDPNRIAIRYILVNLEINVQSNLSFSYKGSNAKE